MNKNLSEKENQIVEDILIEQLGVSADQLTPEARLIEDLQADSLTLMEITLALEEHFDITIPDEQAENVKTVADVYRTVAELLHQPQKG